MDAVVQLREALPSDLAIFFEHQLDPRATAMASFPSRSLEEFMAHWRKILSDGSNTIRTILFNGEVAGYVLAFPQAGRRLVGYWLGSSYWGKGIATTALEELLRLVPTRPVYARAARDNPASIRVLQKCGFLLFTDVDFANTQDDGVQEVVFVLNDDSPKPPGQ